MTPKSYALGQRAIACRRWQWMDGMSASAPGWLYYATILDADSPGRPPRFWFYDEWLQGYTNGTEWPSEWAPEFDDPATLGCLLALVREAWGAKNVHLVRTIDNGWRVYDLPGKASDDASRCYGATEAEALVAALEAAPWGPL